MQTEAFKITNQFKTTADFILQERDTEILRCCYEQQFLTYDQIERFYFRGLDGGNARRRILKLKRAGLLRAEIQSGLTKHHLLRVTETGKRVAKQRSPFDVPQSKKVDPATLVHDTIVTNVRLRLRELWDGTWVPEKALKDKYRLIPDGLFQFEGSATTIAIEVENSLKNRSRFLGNLTEWQRVEGVPLVLFLTTSRTLFEKIRGYLDAAPSSPVFCLAHMDELLGGTPPVHSTHGPLGLFTKRML